MFTFRCLPLPIVLTILSICATAAADDWPQWLGAQRDSVWRETGIISKLPEEGPKRLWQQEIGNGYAGPAVSGERVFVVDFLTSEIPYPSAGRRDKLEGTERVLCMDAKSGQIIWKHEHACVYNISYPYGPRVTPTVDGDHVYTLGAEGLLLCLQVADGKEVWSRQLTKDYECETPIWGFAGHPLIDGQRLVCLVGGLGSIAVAFDKRSGDELWRSLTARVPGYCPPTMIQAGGTQQLLIWHPESLNSLNPENGELFWSQPLAPDYDMSIATPRLDGQHLFVGAIRMKSMCLQLAERSPKAELIWTGQKGQGLGPVFSTPFAENGYLYGVDAGGEIRCVELSSGRHMWKDPIVYAVENDGRRQNNASAFIVKHADRFFLFNDQGDLIIARMTPQRYEELSRAKLLEPTAKSEGRDVLWSHPAFAQRCIFVRNDREIACFDLSEH